MRKLYVIYLVSFFISSSCFPISCPLIFRKITDKFLSKPKEYIYLTVDQQYVRLILNEFWRQYTRNSEPLPQLAPFNTNAFLEGKKQSQELGIKWLQNIQSLDPINKNHIENAKIKVVPTREDGADIWEVKKDSNVWYFRSLGFASEVAIREARYTLNSSRFSELFQSDLVPPSQIAIVNGTVGILSKSANGAKGINYGLGAAAPPNRINTEAQYKMQLLEFLFGQNDLGPLNYSVTSQGNVHVFDHGDCFYPGVPSSKGTDYIGGWQLPEKLPKKLFEKIQNLDEAKIRDFFKGELTELEVEGILLRRKILLRYAIIHPKYFD